MTEAGAGSFDPPPRESVEADVGRGAAWIHGIDGEARDVAVRHVRWQRDLMPAAAGVRRHASGEAGGVARPAPRGPDDVVLTRDDGRRVSGAVVEERRPAGAALNREALRVQPDVLPAGDPVIGLDGVRLER